MIRLLLLLAMLVLAGPRAAAQAAPPHIVFVHVDDLGWLDHSVELPGAPPARERHFRTPHLERLAAEGMVFGHAYASAPVCSPTRVSLMTGQHPARHGVTYWTLHGGRDQSARIARLVPPAWRTDSLQPGDVTLPGLLRDAGYHTIHVGKAHLGARGTPGSDPCALGFDVNIAGHAPGGPGSFLGLHDFSATKRPNRGGDVWDVPGLAAYHGQDVFLTDVLAIEASRALERGLASGRRVFLHFAPYAVHAPLMVNARLAHHNPDLEGPELAYATMVESVDDALGLLLATLERRGVLDDTLVVFTSDNGGLSAHGRGGEPHTHNAPLASGKGSALEGGVRVPLVVRWPRFVAPGQASLVPIVTHDWFPTLLGFAQVAIPAGHAVDGMDLAPVLFLNPKQSRARSLWWHMPHFWGVHGPGIEPYSALRRGPLKLIHYHDERPATDRTPPGDAAGPGRVELYDLAADPGETRDLTRERPDEARALAAELAQLQGAAVVGLSRSRVGGHPVPDALRSLELQQR